MVEAIVLLQTEVGKAAPVAKECESIPGVTLSEIVTGPYDVVIRIEAQDVDVLGKTILERTQAIDGITRTLTCPIVHL